MNEIDLVREALGRPRPTEQETAAAFARVQRDIASGAAARRSRGLTANPATASGPVDENWRSSRYR